MATLPTAPRRTQAKLGRAYWAFHGQVSQDVGSQFLPWVNIADLEAIEGVAAQTPGSQISELHQTMLESLQKLAAQNTEEGRKAFKQLYDKAVGLTLSSDAKRNTPGRFAIGLVDQDLRECCHARLFASAG